MQSSFEPIYNLPKNKLFHCDINLIQNLAKKIHLTFKSSMIGLLCTKQGHYLTFVSIPSYFKISWIIWSSKNPQRDWSLWNVQSHTYEEKWRMEENKLDVDILNTMSCLLVLPTHLTSFNTWWKTYIIDYSLNNSIKYWFYSRMKNITSIMSKWYRRSYEL